MHLLSFFEPQSIAGRGVVERSCKTNYEKSSISLQQRMSQMVQGLLQYVTLDYWKPQVVESVKLSERVVCGSDLIASKLQRQYAHSQHQRALEHDKEFRYLSAPADFRGEAQTEIVEGKEVAICHFIGRRPTMEDEHLADSFDLIIQGKTYPIQLFGIFDGHGGNEASRFVKQHLKQKLHETLEEYCVSGLTDEAIWNALKITFVRLKEDFGTRPSGTTATVAMILDGKLWTANVGDSRTILDNGIQLSEDAKPYDPRYRRGIEHRRGFVALKRVNGCLAVARAIGDHNIGAISARPKITVCPLSLLGKGTNLILACDGIYDVASTRQIAAAVRKHRDLPYEELARNLVYSAYKAQSGDNLSVLIVQVA